MNNIMAVFLNGIAQLEYDRDKLLPDHQAAYLDKMDARMDAGIREWFQAQDIQAFMMKPFIFEMQYWMFEQW